MRLGDENSARRQMVGRQRVRHRPVDCVAGWLGGRSPGTLMCSRGSLNKEAPVREGTGQGMRITYLHQHFCTPGQAGGTRSYEFAKRLAADGHQVTMISGGEETKNFEVAGFSVKQVEARYSNSMSFSRRAVAFIDFMVKATATSLTTPTDIVFATSTPLTVAVPGLVTSLLRRKPLVFEVRDLWPSVPARLGILRSRPLLWLAQLLERAVYRRSRTIIALSPGMRDGVLQTAPLADVRVIPNASDIELFSATADERRAVRERLGWSGRPVVIYAGSFGITYRIPWVVHLASLCPDIIFQIIGSGAASYDAERLAISYGLNPAEILPGELPKTEVAKRVGAADIVLSSLDDHPALQANSLNKVFDALAAGRPVAFNHGGWLTDLLVTRGAGWRLSDDPGAAAGELRSILLEGDSVLAASEAAAELARDQFDRDALYLDFRKALLDC
jgi:Glycosyl transferase 4-like domain